jgi:hypothetical protein
MATFDPRGKRLAAHSSRYAHAAALLFAFLLSGCGQRQVTAKPVDPDMAQRTLESVLTHWKAGGTPEQCGARTPQVVVQDLDWSGGARLMSYEILGAGDKRDANLFCDVKLVLEDVSRKKLERTVTYCVGTDPVLTVFRALPY